MQPNSKDLDGQGALSYVLHQFLNFTQSDSKVHGKSLGNVQKDSFHFSVKRKKLAKPWAIEIAIEQLTYNEIFKTNFYKHKHISSLTVFLHIKQEHPIE